MGQDNTVPSSLMLEKRCSMCGLTKAAEFFYVLSGKLSSRCRPCTRQQVKDWQKDHKERAGAGRRERDRRRYQEIPAVRAKSNAKSKARYHRLKAVVFAAYGGPMCACCGETIEDFLSIDHVNNDGAQHRTRTGGGKHGATGRLYAWIIRNEFPADFQILCYNCNCGKARNNGVCPHKTEGVTTIAQASTLQAKGSGSAGLLTATYGC